MPRIEGKTYTVTVKLPRCWKRLVNVEFPDDLRGILPHLL